MNIGFYVFLGLYAILTMTHLVFCFLEMEKARAISKPFIMLLLAVSLIFLEPKMPIIYISCLFCMVGDIFMLFKHDFVCFSLGALMFAIHHTLNFIQSEKCLSYDLHWGFYVGFVGLFFLMLLVGYFLSKKKMHGLLAFGFAFFHIMMLIQSFLLIFDGKYLYGSFLLLGYLLCIASDLFLDYTTNRKDVKRRDFYIMLTYLLGELSILMSVSFMSIALLS